MEILSEDALSVESSTRPDENSLLKSRVYVHGEVTRTLVEGAVLEAAISVGARYLLFLTDDIPSEDMLHIHLLDAEFDVLESLTLGAAYTTGTFRKLEIIEPDIARFEFIGATQWQVKVLESRRFHLPFIGDP